MAWRKVDHAQALPRIVRLVAAMAAGRKPTRIPPEIELLVPQDDWEKLTTVSVRPQARLRQFSCTAAGQTAVQGPGLGQRSRASVGDHGTIDPGRQQLVIYW
jgi:hypothetical protein